MESLNTATLINLLGFTVGLALYALLLAMAIRHRRKDAKIDLLLILTAVLGILWNFGELFSLVWKDFAKNPIPPLLIAISFSALGFLPSVVVNSAENESKDSRVLSVAAYALSFFAAVLHIQSAIYYKIAPSNLALEILTVGAFALIGGLLFFNYRKKLDNRAIWVSALLVFALSALHLATESEESSWLVELIAHQSSLPLVLAILFQDYRFAFADLFLKRALSLLFLALMVFSLYLLVAEPLRLLHLEHGDNDSLSIGILLLLWIATALVYPFLHQFSVYLVDKVILKRVSYEDLQLEIAQTLDQTETIELVLDNVREKLAGALSANKSLWRESPDSVSDERLPNIEYSGENAEIQIPVNEPPFYKITLKKFIGGRKLLSDDFLMLEAVSLLTARRIDALRVNHERCEQEIREQEFAKLASEAQLSALRSQINPHFLFNALTTIGYLIQSAPDKAFDTLMHLTRLLRRVLISADEFCTMREEIELIENYLDIERARFEERLDVEIDVPEELMNEKIPSLILQPLVENSIKHAISVNKIGGRVKIAAKYEGSDGDKKLVLQVFDSGAGESSKPRSSSKGIGLENIKQRLKAYYGKKAGLKVSLLENSGTLAEIRFPAKEKLQKAVLPAK